MNELPDCECCDGEGVIRRKCGDCQGTGKAPEPPVAKAWSSSPDDPEPQVRWPEKNAADSLTQ